jgi:hypothetical protein
LMSNPSYEALGERLGDTPRPPRCAERTLQCGIGPVTQTPIRGGVPVGSA